MSDTQKVEAGQHWRDIYGDLWEVVDVWCGDTAIILPLTPTPHTVGVRRLAMDYELEDENGGVE
jgi:hypothetical protein